MCPIWTRKMQPREIESAAESLEGKVESDDRRETDPTVIMHRNILHRKRYQKATEPSPLKQPETKPTSTKAPETKPNKSKPTPSTTAPTNKHTIDGCSEYKSFRNKGTGNSSTQRQRHIRITWVASDNRQFIMMLLTSQVWKEDSAAWDETVDDESSVG